MCRRPSGTLCPGQSPPSHCAANGCLCVGLASASDGTLQCRRKKAWENCIGSRWLYCLHTAWLNNVSRVFICLLSVFFVVWGFRFFVVVRALACFLWLFGRRRGHCENNRKQNTPSPKQHKIKHAPAQTTTTTTKTHSRPPPTHAASYLNCIFFRGFHASRQCDLIAPQE